MGFSAHAQAQCDSLDVFVDAARAALLDARLEDAAELMGRAQDSLGCSGVPSAEEMSALWLTEGARLYFLGDEVEARHAFAAAARLAPGFWFSEFGDALHAIYLEASVASDVGHGSVALEEPLPYGYQSWLDGQTRQMPVTVDAGMHLFQVVDGDGASHHARLFLLSDQEVLTINPGVLPEVMPPPSPRFLIGGSVLALAAGGLAVGALLQNSTIETASAMSDLERSYRRQKAMGIGSYSLAGLSLVSVGIYVVQ